MNKKIICSTSFYSVGCTFMDWSILYLSGRKTFYNHLCGTCDISNSPLTNINSHNHNRNHPAGFNLIQHTVDKFLTGPEDLLTLYPVPAFAEDVGLLLGINQDDLSQPEKLKLIQTAQFDDYIKSWNYLLDHDAKIIYVEADNRVATYLTHIRQLDKMFFSKEKPKSFKEVDDQHQSIFFQKSIDDWEKSGLTNVWDIRERNALSRRPLKKPANPTLPLHRPHYYINALEWLNNSDTAILKIMDFCELNVDKTRWNSWQIINSQWRDIQQRSNLTFEYQLPHIVESIINGWYYKIDLTFDQEVIVQHCLIYQHNLNLKTWQLEKFPNNTQELHKLLEDNIHPLEDV